MKKLFLIIILSVIAVGIFHACEEDDICIEGKTPQLILKFKNEENPTQKMDSLYIFQADSIGSYKAIVSGVGRDSVSIPLPLKKTNETRFIFSTRKDYTAENSDKATLSYDYSTQYISKACGFKAVYKNLNLNLFSHHFIKSYKILRNEITDQSAPHIQLNY